MQILQTVVHENRPIRRGHRHAKDSVVYPMRRLSNAEPARRKKCRKDLAQPEPLDAMAVELLALVVQRRHPHTRRGNLASNSDALRPRYALRKHERLELIARERSIGAKHRDIEV